MDLPPGGDGVGMSSVVIPIKPVSSGHPSGNNESRVNIIEKTNEEILATANLLWRDLIKASNEGK